MTAEFDVAIIGGGPAGATCGTLLLKYNPRLRVLILEREKFPRDHIGESQLPLISQVLDEMGCWDSVERANFPIKVGATYRWGQTDELWDFEFIRNGELDPERRPAKFQGQRRHTAFQVDRAEYDKILLDHARRMGCVVREETTVRQVVREGDGVQNLVLEDGGEIRAKYYVDCSGHSGILRRAMGVDAEYPTSLQNIAIWDYWQNAEWAVNIGVGGTRVQVMSVSYGWIWFIPLGPTRTSIGLVIPAKYYKESGRRPEELYREAVCSDPVISQLIAKATSEDKLSTTRDWSFLASRLSGENWFLAGESAGFADPILAAGMTLAHMGARDVAYTILAAERGDYEPEWLRSRYDLAQRTHILQHIRFADYWYTANGQFTELVEFTAEIARDAGLELTPNEAWQWLGTGGFISGESIGAGLAGFGLRAVKGLAGQFAGEIPSYIIDGQNVFRLNLEGAEREWGATLEGGRITRHRRYARGDKRLPNVSLYGLLISILKKTDRYQDLLDALTLYGRANGMHPSEAPRFVLDVHTALEAMVSDGWVDASVDPSQPVCRVTQIQDPEAVHPNRDVAVRFGLTTAEP